MKHNHWIHALHAGHQASHRGKHKMAGFIYIVVGFFMAPILIGIPIMLYGFWKLVK